MNSIGHVAQTIASHRASSESGSSYATLLRETVENKLYYLRDTHPPDEFDSLVDQELLCMNSQQVTKDPRSLCARIKKTLKKFVKWRSFKWIKFMKRMDNGK